MGSYCHHGIPVGQTRYDSAADAKKSGGVMCGASNGQSVFCEHCSQAEKNIIFMLAEQHCDGCELNYVEL